MKQQTVRFILIDQDLYRLALPDAVRVEDDSLSTTLPEESIEEDITNLNLTIQAMNLTLRADGTKLKRQKKCVNPLTHQ